MASEIEKIKTELSTAKAENQTLAAKLEVAEKEKAEALALLDSAGDVAKIIEERNAALAMVEDLSNKLAIKEKLIGGDQKTFEVAGGTYVITAQQMMVRHNGETLTLTAAELAESEEYADLRASLVAKGVGTIKKIEK